MEYSNSYHYFQASDYPGVPYANEPATSRYTSGILRANNYLLNLSLQINLNSGKALHSPTFKGVKSYVGISYAGAIVHMRGQSITYDAITKQTTAFEAKENWLNRSIGINYYGSYSLSKHLVLSLQAVLYISTSTFALDDYGNNNFYFTDPRTKGIGGWHGDYTSSLCLGLAYKFAKH